MSVHARRIESGITVDGHLDDPAWAAAPTISEFTQREPQEGQAATQRTVVRVLFDDGNLYVAAELFDTSPDSIISQLERRDRFVNADQFMVMLDPYHDKRSGYYFGVNAAGMLYDGTLFNDEWDDDSWDGVWSAATRRGRARLDGGDAHSVLAAALPARRVAGLGHQLQARASPGGTSATTSSTRRRTAAASSRASRSWWASTGCSRRAASR